MDLQLVRHHLAEAERHVALGEKHIARQTDVVAYLKERGYPVQLAIDLLHTYQAAQANHLRHRDAIRAELAMASEKVGS